MRRQPVSIAVIFIFSFLWASLNSIQWVKTIYFSDGEISKSYIPIRYFPGSLSDDYFYYSKARDYIDKKFLSGDPTTEGEPKKFTPHSMYFLSLLGGSLGGLISGDAETNIYSNKFVWPLITAILWSLYLLLLTDSLILAILISGITFLSCPDLSRFPNILVTNIPLTVLFILLAKSSNGIRGLCGFATNIIVGTSLIVSVPNFLISIFMASSYYLKDLWNKNYKDFLKNFITTLLFGLPGLVLLFKSLETQKEWFSLAIPPLDQYKGLKIKVFTKDIIDYFSLPFFLFAIPVSYKYKKVLFFAFISLFTGYVLVSFLDGSFLARYFISRGADLFIISLPYVLVALTLLNLPVYHAKQRKLIYSLIVLSFLIFFLKLAPTLYKSIRTSIEKPNMDLELRELYTWLNHNSKIGQNAFSLDPDLHLVLNVYTPINLYLPWAQLSPIPSNERINRFLDLLSIAGLNQQEQMTVLKSIKPHYEMASLVEPLDIRRAQLQLILFYGKFSKDNPDQDAIEEMQRLVQAYFRMVRNLEGIKFDFIIKSTYDLVQPKKGSNLMSRLNHSIRIFKNKKYEVWKVIR